MAIKSIIDLNKDLSTTLNNVPALIETLERGFAGVNKEISTGGDVKKTTDNFETINGGLLSECKVKLTPVQSGSGDPSPTNARAIIGHTQVEVNVSDGQTTQEEITVNLGGTYYGGTVDLVSGEMRVNKVYAIFDGSLDENWSIASSENVAYIELSLSAKIPQAPISNLFKGVTNTPYQNLNFEEFAFSTNTSYKNYINIKSNIITSESDLTTWQTWLSNNNLQVCYELETPQTIQLSPTMVKALAGENNISAPLDGQEIEEVEYKEIFTFADVEEAIENAVASVYPASPAADGTYVLTLVKSGSTITRSWESTES